MDKIETVWKMRECSMQEVKELAYELEIPIPVAQVMLTRGIDSVEKVEQFLDLKINKLHDPTTLPDAEIAIKRISKAIDSGEKIFVWGDYDVDGITSTAIVVTALEKMGANIEYKVPHRMEDGYDIKMHSVDQALASGATLLMSVDCGIVAFETGAYAKEKNLDLIITDHHHPSEDGSLPEAMAVVNPKQR